MPNKIKNPVTDNLPKDKLTRCKETCKKIGLLLKELEKLNGEIPTSEMIKALTKNNIHYHEVNEPPTF